MVRRRGSVAAQGVETVRAPLEDPSALRVGLRGLRRGGALRGGVRVRRRPGRGGRAGQHHRHGRGRAGRRGAGVRRVVVTSSSVTRGSSPDGGAAHRARRPRRRAGARVLRQQGRAGAGRAAGRRSSAACRWCWRCRRSCWAARRSGCCPATRSCCGTCWTPPAAPTPAGATSWTRGTSALGHLLLLEHGEPGERYLLGGQNVSWRTLHATVAELAGLPGPFLEVPRPVAQAVARVADGWGRLTSSAPLVTPTRRTRSAAGTGTTTRAGRLLGYAPRSARDAVASSLAWLLVG